MSKVGAKKKKEIGMQFTFRDISSSCYWLQVVKVWDFDTGHQIFEFGGTQDLTGITCMTFDSIGRRYDGLNK